MSVHSPDSDSKVFYVGTGKSTPGDRQRRRVLRKNLENMILNCEDPHWVNLTFQECVVDKVEAEVYWARLAFRLREKYPGIIIEGVWARQKRLAWHMHFVSSCRIDAAWLRGEALVQSGFGPICHLARIGGINGNPTWRDAKWLSVYISGYCTLKNGLDPVKDKGVRRVVRIGKLLGRVGMKFRSVIQQVVSAGKSSHRELFLAERDALPRGLWQITGASYGRKCWEEWGEWYNRMREVWFWHGWESMSNEEQNTLLRGDAGLRDFFISGNWFG